MYNNYVQCMFLSCVMHQVKSLMSVISCFKVHCDVEVDFELHDKMCKVLVCARG